MFSNTTYNNAIDPYNWTLCKFIEADEYHSTCRMNIMVK